jgi:cellulose synthase/poly-beta-1,6-N-acetylglucosamine synthase-like glycosyltransferase
MLQTKFKSAYILSAVITVLALVASAGGLFIGDLYRDNAFVKTAWYGNDLMTLLVAVPLLVVTLILSMRGSQRAQLVWLGLLVYMLYNYAFYLFGAAFNRFFLIYVALFALSIFALIFALPRVDVNGISQKFQARTPVKWISGFMLFFALLLGGIWIAQSLGFVASGQVPQTVADTGHPTSVVFALDLSLLMPGMILGAILLWKRQPWGYVLGAMMIES